MYSPVSATFLIKKSKPREDHSCQIYVRISVNGKRSEIFTHRYCNPNDWCRKKSRKNGTKPNTRKLNNHLDNIYSRIIDIHQSLFDRKERISSNAIKNKFLGINQIEKSIVEVFNIHNEEIRGLIDLDYKKSTFTKYNTTYKRLKDFIKFHYNKKDVYLIDLDYQFIQEFYLYLKIHRNIDTNTSNKYITHLKKVVNLAIDYNWLDKNPFNNFKLKNKQVHHTPLSADEINKIRALNKLPDHLEITRDVFLFCCYTGLAFIDVKTLQNFHIEDKIDGSQMISKKRQKTNILSRIPLLPQASDIIYKYYKYPKVRDAVLPVRTNQSYNRALKKLAKLSGINKKLTSHMARHTFATELGNNSVPISTIECALGHRNNSMTAYYTKISDNKLIKDFSKLLLFNKNHLIIRSA